MSKIQQQRQNAARGSAYPGTFEAWQVRPVFIVQCFTCQVSRAIGQDHPWFRTVNPYKREAATERQHVADFIRKKRREGLTADQVRKIALIVIDAPESYAGKLRSKAVDEAKAAILKVGKGLLDNRKKPLAIGDTVKNVESGWRGVIQRIHGGELLECLGVNWWDGELDQDDRQWHDPYDVVKQPMQAPQPNEAPSTTNFL